MLIAEFWVTRLSFRYHTTARATQACSALVSYLTKTVTYDLPRMFSSSTNVAQGTTPGHLIFGAHTRFEFLSRISCHSNDQKTPTTTTEQVYA